MSVPFAVAFQFHGSRSASQARIVVVQNASPDPLANDGGAIATIVATAEGIVAPTDRNGRYGTLGSVIGHAEAAGVAEARERTFALRKVQIINMN